MIPLLTLSPRPNMRWLDERAELRRSRARWRMAFTLALVLALVATIAAIAGGTP